MRAFVKFGLSAQKVVISSAALAPARVLAPAHEVSARFRAFSDRVALAPRLLARFFVARLSAPFFRFSALFFGFSIPIRSVFARARPYAFTFALVRNAAPRTAAAIFPMLSAQIFALAFPALGRARSFTSSVLARPASTLFTPKFSPAYPV